jgi:hypothetical protein
MKEFLPAIPETNSMRKSMPTCYNEIKLPIDHMLLPNVSVLVPKKDKSHKSQKKTQSKPLDLLEEFGRKVMQNIKKLDKEIES